MCPSWKATRERRHSPKGRAQLIREWLRQLAALGFDPIEESRFLRSQSRWRTLTTRARNTLAKRRGEPDFSHAVKEALDGCLACKSCTGQCPIKVDVPTFRAKFFELYYGRYLRPLRDHVVGAVEQLAPALARMPRLANTLTGSAPTRAALRAIGLVALPKIAEVDFAAEIERRTVAIATSANLRSLSASERTRSVVVVQDAFTRFYEAKVVLDLVDLIAALGFRPWLAPFQPNGKPLHVHGFLKRFVRVAQRNAAMLMELSKTGVDLVGLDPSMTLTYRSEFPGMLGWDRIPRVLLPQEWLIKHRERLPVVGDGAEFRLLPHCTERTLALGAVRDWVAIFAAMGLRLTILPSGCCGMAGTYGHEAEHRDTSVRIYGLSWARYVAEAGSTRSLVATGYSCRSQVELIDGVELAHPVQALLSAVQHPALAGAHAQPASPEAQRAGLHQTPMDAEAAQME
jgi:Fe-S oxidoreductase